MFTLLNSIKFLKQLKNLLKIFTSPRRVWEFIYFIYTHILYLWYCHLHFSFPDFFSFWSIWYIWRDCGFIYVVFTTDYFKLSVPCVWTDCIIDSLKFLLIYVIIFFSVGGFLCYQVQDFLPPTLFTTIFQYFRENCS